MPGSTEPGIRHPYVVLQAHGCNGSGVHMVVVCALTSNIKRVAIPGNILLTIGEANLPRPSVVEVSKVATVDKGQLGAYIGTLSEARVKEICAGIRFQQRSFFAR
ncbi:MAG: type II toxin-antitoxin system PemK/MazF family toxin [Anaerolineae bacterium]|nr:type II toxin-antitoxin system PemK/MazF family toxin [Anaerolineae bacterium]